MEIAEIYVKGVTASAYNVKKIPKGIIGATIKATFANEWHDLEQIAVFQGVVTRDVVVSGSSIPIPAECVAEAGYQLRVGFYGVADETMVIPTIWADLGMIQDAADPFGDESTVPTLPIWAQLKSPARIAEIHLLADKWEGENNLYTQIVDIPGVTEYSKVDITPSAEQLAVFYDKDLCFVTENEDGVVTVYVIGQKPANDYTIQATITEVSV